MKYFQIFISIFMFLNTGFITGDTLFAQEINWTQDVDLNTEWGKWLTKTFKPYFEEQKKAQEILNFSANEVPDVRGMSQNDGLKALRALQEPKMTNFCKVIQTISPPDELKIFHSKLIEASCGEVAKYPDSYDQEKMMEKIKTAERLKSEANQELLDVFKRHGVPDNIISKFVFQQDNEKIGIH